MIYKSLDTIPYKLFLKIEETKYYFLLDTNFVEKKNIKGDELVEYSKQLSNYETIWNDLYDEHLSKNQNTESKKIFKLSKTIDEYLTSNKVIVMGCDALLFEYNEDIHKILITYGFKLSLENTQTYHKDLKKIKREAEAFIIRAKRYQAMLPEKKENTEYNIDDVMASYSAILGYNIGKHNEVTYAEYYGHEKSVNSKIKSIKSQNNKSNGK